MKHTLIILSLSSLLLLAGCADTQQAADSLTNSGQDVTQETTENTNTAEEVRTTLELSEANLNNVVENVVDTEDDVTEETEKDSSEDIDTSDWVTYENEEYGFSFKYPEDLDIDVKVNENRIIFTYNNTHIGEYNFLTIQAFSNENKLTVENWLAKFVNKKNPENISLHPFYNDRKTNVQFYSPGFKSLEEYSQNYFYGAYFTNPDGDMVFGLSSGQDHSVFEELGYTWEVAYKMIDLIGFEK